MKKILICTVAMLLVSSVASAMTGSKDGCGSQECSKCHSLSVDEANKLLGFAGVKVKSVKPAYSSGLYEIFFEKDGGKGIVFIDYGKKHLIQGQIISLKTMEPVAAHEKEFPRPKQFTGLDPKLIPVKHAVVMGNAKAVKKLYIFTDPDCPYCRSLHSVLQQLEKQMPDLAINIMLFPIPQLHPESYDKCRKIISTQRRDLLDTAFNGKAISKPKGNEGKSAVDAIIKFAGEQGINGTPMILLQDGKLYQGPRTVEDIKKAVDGR